MVYIYIYLRSTERASCAFVKHDGGCWWMWRDCLPIFVFFIRSQVKEWQETQQALSGRVRDSIFRSSGHKVALPNPQPQYTGNRPRVHPQSMQSRTASVSQKRAFVAGFHSDSSVFALDGGDKKKNRPKFDRWSRKNRKLPKYMHDRRLTAVRFHSQSISVHHSK